MSELGARAGGWPVVIAYGAITAATQLLWLTYAPITTDSAHRYGVSVGAIGWLSEIFPLLYVLLAIPSGRMLDRWLRPSLAGGAVLVAAGGVVRLGGESFGWALTGQVLIAVAQPVVMSAVPALAGGYLPASQRPAGIAAASAAAFAGMVAALLLGPAFGGAHLMALLALQAALGVAAALCMCAALLRRPPADRTELVAMHGSVARALWRRREVKIISALAFIGFGVFVALSTWLQTLLHPAGISDTLAGALLVGMLLAGVAGCAVLPPLVDRHAHERAFMVTIVLVGALCGLTLALITAVGIRALAMVVIGLAMLPALPVILTLAERLAGPAAGTAGAIIWLAGNLGGLVVALTVEALVHHSQAAFLTLAGVSLLGLPFALRMGPVAAAARAVAARAATP